MKFLSALSLFLFFTVSSMAQKAITEGVIVLELTEVKSDDPQMGAMLNNMKGAITETIFSPAKQKTVMNMMGGLMKTTIIFDAKTKESRTYMDMMGNKVMIKMDPAESAGADEAINIKETKETKTILGYPCKKIIIEMDNPQMQGGSVVMYVTDKIKTSQTSLGNNVYTSKIEGTALEMIIDVMGMKMVYTAKSIKDSLPKDAFAEPKGHKEMTLEEFQKSMGGMGF